MPSVYPQNAYLVSFGAYEDTTAAPSGHARYAKRDDVHPYVILDGTKASKEALVNMLQAMQLTKGSDFSGVTSPMTFFPDTPNGVRINLRTGDVSRFINDLLSQLGGTKLIDRDLPEVKAALSQLQPVDPQIAGLEVDEIAARATKEIQNLTRSEALQARGGI